MNIIILEAYKHDNGSENIHFKNSTNKHCESSLRDMKDLYITKRGQVFEAASMSIEMHMLGGRDRLVNWQNSLETSMSERIGILLQFMYEF